MLERIKRIIAIFIILTVLPFSLCYAGTYFSLTVDNTVGGVALPAGCSGTTFVFMVLETAQVRFRFDATAGPTATEGFLVQIGQNITLTGSARISNFKGIRTGGSSGVLKGFCE